MSQIFPPPFLDFQLLFKNSLNSIKGSIYSSIFNNIYPDSSMCKDKGENFTDIGNWYENIWLLKNNSSSGTSVEMCRAYQKECLLNTNWTVVKSWIKEKNVIQSLSQFCPQRPLASSSTKALPGITSSVIPVASKSYNNDKNPSTPSYIPEDPTTRDNQTTLSYFHTSSENNTTPFYPDNLPSVGGHDNDSLKYLAFLSLILPVIIIILVVVLMRRRDKKLRSKKFEHETSCSTLGSSPSIQSFHSTSLKNLIHSSASEKKSKKAKRRADAKALPRQQSTDSNGSTVYFVNVEEVRQDKIANEELYLDPDKEKMMENWKQKLESLAEMLTKSDLNMEINGNVGQEEC